MRKLWKLTLIFGLIFAAASCSTVSSRIKDNERQFGTFPPEVQAQIQNGRIDKGFTEDMVFMAKGEPSEKYKEGKRTIWKYARPTPPSPPGQSSSSISSPFGYPTIGPGPSHPSPMFYDKSYFKIQFENGKVVEWDPDLQNDLSN